MTDIFRHSRLCSSCATIFTAAPLKQSYGPDADNARRGLKANHHSSFSSFQKAANYDCYMCTRFNAAFKNDVNERMQAISHSLRTEEKTRSLDEYFESVTYGGIEFDRDWDFHLVFEVRLLRATHHHLFHALKQERAANMKMQATLASGTRSQQSMQQAKDWIDCCLLGHCRCQKRKATQWLPTRLIRVELDGHGSGVSVRLCLRESVPNNTRYLTLSHRWGSASFTTLTSTNIDQFLQAIDVGGLSGFFEDACFVTRALGFSYIWIDSLCIIQDSHKDWESESKVMNHVYRNAVCNIAATGFEDGSDGFLVKHRSRNPVPPLIHPKWPSLELAPPPHIKLAGRKLDSDQWFILTDGLPWRDICCGPLFQRAWVLQEQILAPRTLHFDREQIFWECSESFASEVWPSGFFMDTPEPNPFVRYSWDGVVHPVWQINLEALAEEDTETVHKIWREIIQDYTTRNISYHSDRLPALDGIAAEFGEILKTDSYCFGLWINDISSLLWRLDGSDSYNQSDSAAQDCSNAPSWSWASYNQPVRWLYRNKDWIPQVRFAQFANPTNMQNPRETRVKGPLLSLRDADIVIRDNPNRYDFTPTDNYQRYSDKKMNHEMQFSSDFDKWFLRQLLSTTIDQRPRVSCLLQSVFFLPILKVYSLILGQRQGWAWGLLLQHHPDKARGVYRRIGTGTLNSSSEVEALFAQYQRTLTPNDYEEDNDHGLYTVILV